jgi:hypothetical protein
MMEEKDVSENISQVPEEVNKAIENKLRNEKPEAIKNMNIKFNNIADQLDLGVHKILENQSYKK